MFHIFVTNAPRFVAIHPLRQYEHIVCDTYAETVKTVQEIANKRVFEKIQVIHKGEIIATCQR